MPADEPGDGLGLFGREAEARPELFRDLRAQHRVIAAAAFGDVVQQHRKIERAARIDRREEARRQRQLFCKRAAFDIRQNADREDRVLVDRIGVIHVVLHLRDDTAEIGDEAAEHAQFIHPAQRDLGIDVVRRQNFDEEPIRLGIVAQFGIDELQRLGDEAQRMRMDVEPFLLRDVEEPQERDRVLGELILARDIEPAGIDGEAFDRFLAEAPALQREFRLVAMLRIRARRRRCASDRRHPSRSGSNAS